MEPSHDSLLEFIIFKKFSRNNNIVLRECVKERCLSKSLRLKYRLHKLLEKDNLAKQYEDFLHSTKLWETDTV